jgi:hypothetical protein
MKAIDARAKITRTFLADHFKEEISEFSLLHSTAAADTAHMRGEYARQSPWKKSEKSVMEAWSLLEPRR